MWIISGPRTYLAVFLAGMACGFALGVSATRSHAAELDDYICVDITAPIMPYCTIAEQQGRFPATGCTIVVDGRNHLCLTPTPSQMVEYRRLKALGQ